ncbi:hypothetical protein Tco_1553631 [Tanacetum coccineum]
MHPFGCLRNQTHPWCCYIQAHPLWWRRDGGEGGDVWCCDDVVKVAAAVAAGMVWRGGSECEGDVDGGVVMECRICGGSCGGYDVEGGDGGAAWSGSEVGGARQVAAAVVVAVK